MEVEFINITSENIDSEHLSCIIRSKKPYPGIELKRKWLSERIKEGHVFRKLNVKAPVFIEYAPLETAWVPITGDNFHYIYCLWSGQKGNGYGKKLMEYCIDDSKQKGKSGVCMLGSKKQKAWLSNQDFAKGLDLKLWTLQTVNMNCLRFLLMGRIPKLQKVLKRKLLKTKNLQSIMICNVLLSMKG